MANSEWCSFLGTGSQLMRQALSNEISLEQASEYFDQCDAIRNEELRQFLVRYIWEIDGNRDIYVEILHLLESGATQEKLVEYMNN